MPTDAPTRCCVLTPSGRGAVAVIAAEGPQAVTIVDPHFHSASARSTSEQAIDRIVFGRWGTPDGEEVIVCRRAQDRLEIHCHGGISASTAIVDVLQATGCVVEQASDWIARRESDSIGAEACAALGEAPTERTAGILLNQYRGALRHDFTEIERFLASERHEDRARAGTEIERLLGYTSIGMHLTRPWQVAIAGPPNVGKSSLINALVGYNRAIIYDQPGTTRDIVTAQTAIDGWPVQLADTAGLRTTDDPLEAAGVQRAEDLLQSADLTLLVFDGTQTWDNGSAETAARYPNAVIVYNKADLISIGARQSHLGGIWTSALHGEGLDQLRSTIVERLIPDSPNAGVAIPFTPSHFEYLRSLIPG